MRSVRSRKVVKLLWIIGLPVILLSGLIVQILFRNNRANLINQTYLRLSKYRKLRKYIIAQAKLESANFTSSIYKRTNNTFGMQHPKKRPAVGYESDVYEGGMTTPVQAYRNDTQSFQDLLLWMDYGRFPRSVASAAEYVAELKKRGYFTSKESDYLKGLNFYL